MNLNNLQSTFVYYTIIVVLVQVSMFNDFV